MDLKDYKKTLPKEIIKQASKMLVRELDEVKPSHYESYVDDANETYDVKIAINKAGIIAKTACDCEDGNTTFCVHKAAVVITLAENKKVGSKIKATKVKANPTQLLLEDIDTNLLKDWVYSLLQKNKDLELAFTINFAKKPTTYTSEEVTKITETAYKAIVRNKKNIEQTELKKLLELWGQVHEPIVTNYLNNLLDYENFLNLHNISFACRELYHRLNLNTVKIHNYVIAQFVKVIEPLNNFVVEDNFYTVAKYFINASKDSNNLLIDYYFVFCIKLIEVSTKARQIILIDLLVDVFKNSKLYHLYDGEHPTKKLLEVVQAAGLFNKYFEIFSPITFDNKFNILLIQALIDNEHYGIAEKYCNTQIANNYRDEYNIVYFNFLKIIYTKTNSTSGLQKVCTLLLPITFNIEDYLFTINLIVDENIKKDFRNKIYTKARSSGKNGNVKAEEFCFNILHAEKRYLKMIDIINSYTPYKCIVEYFEEMFFANKDNFIKALMNKSDPWNYYDTRKQNEEEFFEPLYGKLINHYGEKFVKVAFNNNANNYYRDNEFMFFVEAKLKE